MSPFRKRSVDSIYHTGVHPCSRQQVYEIVHCMPRRGDRRDE
jgi:hypothetical protein